MEILDLSVGCMEEYPSIKTLIGGMPWEERIKNKLKISFSLVLCSTEHFHALVPDKYGITQANRIGTW
jgi:hypothetical protein